MVHRAAELLYESPARVSTRLQWSLKLQVSEIYSTTTSFVCGMILFLCV